MKRFNVKSGRPWLQFYEAVKEELLNIAGEFNI